MIELQSNLLGVGTTSHIVGEVFKSATGVNIVHVPYKGGGLAIVDLVAGQIALSFADMVPSVPQVKDTYVCRTTEILSPFGILKFASFHRIVLSPSPSMAPVSTNAPRLRSPRCAKP